MKSGRTTTNKALDINLNTQIYGTFAEIGAGQEVARFFFQAGKASQTIAKTISAYDMVYSDEIYGKEASGRYVCQSRLEKMLTKEFNLLTRRLEKTRGKDTCFFAYANTIATGDQKKRISHGWMGVRFQAKPGGEPNDIILHVRLLDRHRLQQQETLGVLGVNLVHAAFSYLKKPAEICSSITENIKPDQISIDFIEFRGPDVQHINTHLANLEFVRTGYADAVLFGPDQKILNVSDALFQKPLLIQRGSFHPVTNTHVDVLEKGLAQFRKENKSSSKDPIVMFELTMHNLQKGGQIHEKDFLDRVTTLCSLGHHVLVSNFFLYYRLKQFLRMSTDKHMIMILSAFHLPKIFDENYYKDLDGGLLEGLSKLLNNDTTIYVYPHKDGSTCTTSKSFFPEKKWLSIYQHFQTQKQIVDISACDETADYLHSDYVRELIQKKNKKWEACVPPQIRDLIKKQKLFGI